MENFCRFYRLIETCFHLFVFGLFGAFLSLFQMLMTVSACSCSLYLSVHLQPLFSHPRPKRCATHCYIARNIHYLQQFMKMNPFWPPPAGSAASLFGAKPCNLNLMPSAELQGNNAASKILNSVQEKGQGLSIFPGQAGKDKGSQANNIADAQRKQQQIMLQQALPPGAPNNILVLPFNS